MFLCAELPNENHGLQAVEVRAYPPLLRVIVADERRSINQKPQAPRSAKGAGLRRVRLGSASSGAEGKAGEFHYSPSQAEERQQLKVHLTYFVFATTRAITLLAPLLRRTRTASFMVAPDVKTSSIRIIFLFATRFGLETAKHPAIFSVRFL